MWVKTNGTILVGRRIQHPFESISVVGLVDVHWGYDLDVDQWPKGLPSATPVPSLGPGPTTVGWRSWTAPPAEPEPRGPRSCPWAGRGDFGGRFRGLGRRLLGRCLGGSGGLCVGFGDANFVGGWFCSEESCTFNVGIIWSFAEKARAC